MACKYKMTCKCITLFAQLALLLTFGMAEAGSYLTPGYLGFYQTNTTDHHELPKVIPNTVDPVQKI